MTARCKRCTYLGIIPPGPVTDHPKAGWCNWCVHMWREDEARRAMKGKKTYPFVLRKVIT